MKTGEAGRALIESFEALRLKAYPDPKTGGEPWTIGWGHTGSVREGDTCTEAEADALLAGDLMHAEDVVNELVRVTLSQDEFDALVSFVYNCGEGNFAKSTLLRLLNQMKYDQAADEILKWISPGTSVEKGLRRRRDMEWKLFLRSST